MSAENLKEAELTQERVYELVTKGRSLGFASTPSD